MLPFTNSHLNPPSVERYNPFFLFSIKAYTRSGLLAAMSTPMRPISPSGKPSLLVRFVQVLPPSNVMNKPDPGPPDLKVHGQRRCCHMAAINLFGLRGSITRSAQPVFSSTNKTLFHVSPPS